MKQRTDLIEQGVESNEVVRGRLAPSPTGALHVGHARTFLVAWLSVRSVGGRVILRIEDIDRSRVRPGMAELAMTDLRWLGLDWDEGPDQIGPSAPYEQSERLERYQEALERLKRDERVYPCTCTRSEINRAASAPHPGEEGPIYPGTCASRSSSDADSLGSRPYCWRFRVDRSSGSWEDRIRGQVTASCNGDFIISRSDGDPSYQLAVVVDDAAMGVTEVIRGDDLVNSTPKQLMLYDALQLRAPRFGHLPLVVGSDGRRLAKRDHSIKLMTLRESGVDPQSLVGWLGESFGVGDGSESRPQELVSSFSLDRIPVSPAVFSQVAFEQRLGQDQNDP